MSLVRVALERIGPCAYEAWDEEGNRVRVAGSAELAQQILERVPDPSIFTEPAPLVSSTAGFRPMALFLVSLAGCSAMDLGLILARQRQDVQTLRITAEGRRASAIPAVYEHITLRFTATGSVGAEALARAADLAVTKYCSVASMLKPEIIVEVDTKAPSA